MAFIYFAKVNINSQIYDVYNNPSVSDAILNELFFAIDQEKRVQMQDGAWAKFINIDKDIEKRFIAGRLVKIFDGDIEIYDSGKDDIEPLLTKELAKSVTFFFDMKTEIIAFTTARFLSRKNFVEYFSCLINSYNPKVTFEIFLKTNSDLLDEQIRKFEHVSKIDIILVPPNSNENEFDDLFPKTGEEIKQLGATKICQTLTSSSKEKGMNLSSSFFKRILGGIANGFGVLKVEGKDTNGETLKITSEKDAPQRKFIPDNQKTSIPAIKEFGRAGIVHLLSNELRIKD